MDQQKRTTSDDASSELSELSSEHPSTTTISTVAVQAGKAKIVLAILRVSSFLLFPSLPSLFFFYLTPVFLLVVSP